jgi:hypothetical protein
MGNDTKLYLLPKNAESNPVECNIRVSPIVARKTLSKEVTTVTHFAIELYEEGSAVNLEGSLSPSRTDDLPVGVMG